APRRALRRSMEPPVRRFPPDRKAETGRGRDAERERKRVAAEEDKCSGAAHRRHRGADGGQNRRHAAWIALRGFSCESSLSKCQLPEEQETITTALCSVAFWSESDSSGMRSSSLPSCFKSFGQ